MARDFFSYTARTAGRLSPTSPRIEENVGGICVVKAFANESHERRLFAADNASSRRRLRLIGVKRPEPDPTYTMPFFTSRL